MICSGFLIWHGLDLKFTGKLIKYQEPVRISTAAPRAVVFRMSCKHLKSEGGWYKKLNAGEKVKWKRSINSKNTDAALRLPSTNQLSILEVRQALHATISLLQLGNIKYKN